MNTNLYYNLQLFNDFFFYRLQTQYLTDADALCCFAIKNILSDESLFGGNHGQFPRIKCAKLYLNNQFKNAQRNTKFIIFYAHVSN